MHTIAIRSYIAINSVATCAAVYVYIINIDIQQIIQLMIYRHLSVWHSFPVDMDCCIAIYS